MVGYWVELLSQVGINSIVALGLYVVMSSGQLSVGHAAFMGMGGYAAALMTLRLAQPFWVGLVVGALVAGMLGLLFCQVTLRLRGYLFAVASLGFGEAMVVIIENSPWLGGPMGLYQVRSSMSPGVIALLVVLAYAVAWRFERSSLGFAARMFYDDEVAASCLGISRERVIRSTFALGCALAGLGGATYVYNYSSIIPSQLNFDASLAFLLYVTVGGPGRFWGPLLGSLVLTLLPELLRFSVYERYILYGLALILLMVFRPNGLIGRRSIWRLVAPQASA